MPSSVASAPNNGRGAARRKSGRETAALPKRPFGGRAAISLAQLLQAEMAEDDFEAVFAAEAFCELLGQVDGAVLAAGAAEGDHEILEAALLVDADSGVYQREDAGQELMDAFLLIEVVDDRGVFAGQGFETLFAARIGEAAAIENEAAAVSGFVGGQGLVKGKTENPHDQIIRFRSQAQQSL